MLSFKCYGSCFCVLVYLLNLAPKVNGQNISLTIPLNKTLTWGNKELYGDFIYLKASSTLQVQVTNVKNVSYIVFQAHTHLYNITLYNNTLVGGSYVKGTNVGLYSPVQSVMDTFYVYNQNLRDLMVYISIHGYTALDPIPGGCNMEFPVAVSPFMQILYNKEYLLVDASPAKDSSDPSCTEINNVVVVFYKMYLPERDFNNVTYFDGLRNMLTIENIEENGEFIPDSGQPMRRVLSTYPAVGSIYVAVAYNSTDSRLYSVYVPTHSYACYPEIEGGCETLEDILSQLLCSLLLFVGLFLCYFGHRFFKTEMFLVGLISGVVISYILISLITDIDGRPALIGASMISGVCFGAIWLLFWWFYGIPILAVLLSTLNVGFLFSSVIYYGLPGGLIALQADLNFWILFISIMLLTSLILVTMTFPSNILCCAILGGYAAIYPIDYLIGSNLRYTMINTLRRAIVPNFNKAVISPPFQWRDGVVTVLWLVLATTGFLFQHYQNRGRPPFPPPPRSVGVVPPPAYEPRRYVVRKQSAYSGPVEYNERTPLFA